MELRIREVVAGPGANDGLVTLGAGPLAARREWESLLISAPGFETKELGEDVLGSRGGVAAIEITLEKETRIVGEMTWPATWAAHVRPERAVIGRAPDDPKASWRSGPLVLEDGGHAFHGEVRGCGRFWVVFHYFLDDAETADLATLEINASSGPEVHVSMVPAAGAREPETGPLFRWTLRVHDGEGSPLEGASITAVRTFGKGTHRWQGPLPGAWLTDRSGEAVRDFFGGPYSFTVHKTGWGATVLHVTLSGDQRDEVRLVPAHTKLILDLAWTSSEGTDMVQVRLWERTNPGGAEAWQPLEDRLPIKSPARLEFLVAAGSEYAMLAQGHGLAPRAALIAKIGAEEKERTVDLVLDGGERVELHGLEQAPTAAEIPVMIQHEGLVGEMMTVTGRASFAAGKWTIDHFGPEAGDVTADFDGRRLRGRLPAAGNGPRIVELR